MPAVAAPAKLLVTGASGFIATWVIKKYLEAGYSVRGTVRSASKGDYLREFYDREHPGKFEYTIVRDIDAPGAFDDTVVGVDGITHVASPVYFPDDTVDPNDIIRPAVNGTLEIFKSAARIDTIKRIVVTGSIVSALQPHDPGYVYSTDDWNEYVIEAVKKFGKAAPGAAKYSASKTLAEMAVWQFMKDNAGSVSFDTNVIMPTWVYGPILQDVKTLADVNLTVMRLFNLLREPVPDTDVGLTPGQFVDVRDVARLHVDAMSRPELGSRRLLSVNTSTPSFQDLYDAYYGLPESERPKLPFAVPRGVPGTLHGVFDGVSDETERLVGWQNRPIQDVVKGTLDALVDRGLLVASA